MRGQLKSILNKSVEFLDRFSFLRSPFFVFIYFLFLIVPEGISEFADAHLNFLLIRIFFFTVTGLIYLSYLVKKKRISLITILIFLYVLGRFLITFYRTGDFMDSLITDSLITAFVISMFTEAEMKENAGNYIAGLNLYCEISLFINAISVFFGPFEEVFDQGYFFEADNIHIVYYLFALAVSYIHYSIEDTRISKIRMIAVWVIVIACTYYMWCATAVFSITALLVCLLLSRKLKICNILTYSVSYIAGFFSIIVFRLQNYFSFLIESILYKNVTFSGRIYVWDTFIEKIKIQPLLGYGYKNKYLKIRFPDKKDYLYAHNHILDEMYCGGIVMLAVYYSIVAASCVKLYKNRDRVESKVLSCIVLAIFMMNLMESHNKIIILLIFCMIYHFMDLLPSLKIRKSSNLEINSNQELR